MTSPWRVALELFLRRAALFSPISRYIVEGDSMLPAYRSGERLVVNKLAFLGRPPLPGEVVVLRDPEHRGHYLLKRVATMPATEKAPRTHVYVLGDNAAESRDSRSFGPVPRGSVVGRAWFRY